MEAKLKANRGQLFQHEMELGEQRRRDPDHHRHRTRIARPKCRTCQDYGLEQDVMAAAGGGWKCGRGHGALA